MISVNQFKTLEGNAGQLTSLGRAEVLAGGGSAGTSTTGHLDAKSSALNDLTLETILGSLSLLGSNHLDETETTGLASVGVLHDLALLNLAVLLEETGNLSLLESGVDASNEEVGAGVPGTILLTTLGLALVLGRSTSVDVRYCCF